MAFTFKEAQESQPPQAEAPEFETDESGALIVDLDSDKPEVPTRAPAQVAPQAKTKVDASPEFETDESGALIVDLFDEDAPAGSSGDFDTVDNRRRIAETGDVAAALQLSKGNTAWALRRALGMDPKVAAKIVALSKRTKMPKSVIASDTNEVEDMLAVRDGIAKIRERGKDGKLKYPVLAQHLNSVAEAAVVKGGRSIASLADIEVAGSKRDDVAQDAQEALNSPYFFGLKEGAKDVARNLLTTIGATRLPPAINAQTGIVVAGLRYAGSLEPVAEAGKYIHGLIEDMKDSDFLEKSEAQVKLSGLRRYWYDFVSMTPQIAGALGVTALAGPAAGSAVIGGHIFGGTYEELIGKGVEEGRAYKAALGNAVIQSALEVAPLGIFMKALKFKGPRKQILRNFFEYAVVEFGTETLQSLPESAAKIWGEAALKGQDMSEQLDIFIKNLPDTIAQGMYEGLVVLPVAGFGASIKVASEFKNLAKYEKAKANLKGLLTLADESDVRKIAPDVVQKFITEVQLKAGKDPSVYVDIEVFDRHFEDNDAAKQKEFENLGVSEEAIKDAREIGTELEIPKALILSKYSEYKLAAAVLDSARFEEGGLNAEDKADIESQAEGLLNEAQSEVETEANKQVDVNEFKDTRETMLRTKDKGGMGLRAEEADQLISLWNANANVLGQSPKEYAESIILSVGGKFEAVEQTDKSLQPTENINREVANALTITEDLASAGFMTPEGKLLTTGDVGGVKGLQEFINLGNVRLSPATGEVDIARELTSQQQSGLSTIVSESEGDIFINLEEGLGVAEEALYGVPSRSTKLTFPEGTKPEKVIAAVKKFFAGEDFKSKVLFQKDKTILPTSSKSFYSQAYREIEGFDFKTIKPKGLLNRLSRIQGLNKEEAEFSGLDEWLNSLPENEKVSKEVILKFLGENGVKVESIVKGVLALNYDSKYAVPEVLSFVKEASDDNEITGAVIEAIDTDKVVSLFPELENLDLAGRVDVIVKSLTDTPDLDLIDGDSIANPQFDRYIAPYEQSDNYREVLLTLPLTDKGKMGKREQFTGGHWDEQDVAAHLRMDDRSTTGRDKVLMIQEMQSDYANEIRRSGTDLAAADLRLLRAEERVNETGETLQDLRNELREKYRPGKVKLSDFKPIKDKVLREGVQRFHAPKELSDRKIPMSFLKAGKSEYKVFFDEFGHQSKHFTSSSGAIGFINRQVQKVWDATQPFPAMRALDATDTNALGRANDARNLAEQELDIARDTPAVSDAPFVGKTESWGLLAFKNALNIAVKEGYDKIAWPLGIDQAQRYGRDETSGLVSLYDESLPRILNKYAKGIDKDAKPELGHIRIKREGMGEKSFNAKKAELEKEVEKYEAQAEFVNGKGFKLSGPIEKVTGVGDDAFTRQKIDVLGDVYTLHRGSGGVAVTTPFDRALTNLIDRPSDAEIIQSIINDVDLNLFEEKESLSDFLGREPRGRIENFNTRIAFGETKIKKLKAHGNLKFEDFTVDSESIVEGIKTTGTKFQDRADFRTPPQIQKTKIGYIFSADAHGVQFSTVTKAEMAKLFASGEINEAVIAHEEKRIESTKQKVAELTIQVEGKRPAHIFNLTPKIKAHVKKGQPLFQKDKEIVRASIDFTKGPEEITINLFKGHNFSSLLHETGHMFHYKMAQAIDSNQASEQMRTDYDTLLKYADGKFDERGNEKVARSFEVWLREGKAPSEALVGAFRRFKSWLLAIYDSLTNSYFTDFEVEINDEIRDVFSRMVASDEEIKKANRHYDNTDRLNALYPEEVQAKQKKATLTAEEKQLRKSFRDHLKALGGKPELDARAKENVEKKDVYRVISSLSEKDTGLDFNDMAETLGEDKANALKSVHPRVFAPQDRALPPQNFVMLVRKLGGIKATKEQAKSFKENGVSKVINKKGMALDLMAEQLIESGEINVPESRNAEDYLQELIETQALTVEGASEVVDEPSTGFTLEEATTAFEYESPELLLFEMLQAPKKSAAIASEAKKIREGLEKRFREQRGEVVEGDQGYHSIDQLDALLAKAEFLISDESVTGENRADPLFMAEINRRRSEHKKLSARSLKAWAREKLEKSSVRKAVAYKAYARTEKKFAKKTSSALLKGDRLEAYVHMRKQYAAHALVLQAVENKDLRLKIENRYKANKIRSSFKKVELAFREKSLDLILKFGLNKKVKLSPEAKIKTIAELDEVLDSQTPAFVDAPRLAEGITDYKDLTLEQLVQLDEAIQGIAGDGRAELLSIKTEYGSDIREFADNSRGEIDQLSDRFTPREVTDALTFKSFVLHPFQSVSDWFNSVEVNKPKGLNTKRFLNDSFDNLIAAQYKTEFTFDILDNFAVKRKGKFGPMREAFNKGVHQETENRKIQEVVNLASVEHWHTAFDAIERIGAEKGFAFDVEGLPVTEVMQIEGLTRWTPEMLFMYVMNLGNQGNIDALNNSYAFSAEQTQVITSHFTESELAAVQGIWNATGLLTDQLDQVNQRMYNKRLVRVEAQQVTMKTKEGTFVTLPGGYHPISFDPRLSSTAEKREMVDLMRETSNGVFGVKPKAGMTIERNNTKYNLPPNLSFNVWFSHIDATTRVITHSEYLRDMHKIIHDEAWRASVRKKMGTSVLPLMDKWLQEQASPGAQARPTNALQKFLRNQKNKATLVILGANVSVGLKQRLSGFGAIRQMAQYGPDSTMADGVKWLASGYSTMVGIGDPDLSVTSGILLGVLGLDVKLGAKKSATELVNGVSDFMRTRMDNFDTEITAALKRAKPGDLTVTIKDVTYNTSDVKNFMFKWIQMNDRGTVIPIWLGAFNQAMAKTSDRDQAIAWADAVVRTTQPSSLPIDLADIQREGGFTKLFTAFMTWMNTWGNILLTQNKMMREGAMTKSEYFGHIFTELMVASWAGATISSLFSRGELPEPMEFVAAPFEYLVAWIPVVRDIAGAFKYDQGITSIAFEGINRWKELILASKKVAERGRDKDWNRFFWKIGAVGDFHSGVPAAKIAGNLQRTYDTIEKKTR